MHQIEHFTASFYGLYKAKTRRLVAIKTIMECNEAFCVTFSSPVDHLTSLIKP